MSTRQQRATAPAPLALGIGSVLSDLKRQRGLSGVRLAELSGLTQSQISRFEHGKVDISVTDLLALCDALEIALEDFMAEARRRAATFTAGGLRMAVSESVTPPKP